MQRKSIIKQQKEPEPDLDISDHISEDVPESIFNFFKKNNSKALSPKNSVK